MGIPTLIKTQTASNSASLDFVDGTSDVVLDGTYDEYMFVFTDINPATDAQFGVQFNVDGASGFNETITSTMFKSYHYESDGTGLVYEDDHDQAQGIALQMLTTSVGSGSDESCAGILHLFSPANTTYVKHFYSRILQHASGDYAGDVFTAGYVNVTGAIDEVEFKVNTGNFDGTIQMYGIK